MTDKAKKVVVVDDEEDVAMYLSDILTDNGYEVRTATDGREGLKLIHEDKPDLVCLDILMPLETGLSLFRKIRLDASIGDIPIIIISGLNYGEQMNGENGHKEDIKPPESYIEKPVKPDQFLDVVRGVIG